MKKFLKEFKQFISKGDVVSMAVGIIIGGAFTAIVTSLVNDIITPLFGVILGGTDFTEIAITVGKESIMVGSFIQAIIDFLLKALFLFFVVKFFNNFKKKEEAAPAPAPVVPEDVKLLTEIRDLLKTR